MESNKQIILQPNLHMQNNISVMKIKEISFSQDYSKIMSKNICQKSKGVMIRSLSLSNSKPNSPSLNEQSNKRLKYYSKRHKQSIATIDDIHLETLRQEFMKFDDNTIKSFVKINSTHKKDAINLIAKKYNNIRKTQSIQEIIDFNRQNNNENSNSSDLINLRPNIQIQNVTLRTSNNKLINISPLKPIDRQKSIKTLCIQQLKMVKNYQNNYFDKWESINHHRKLSISSSKSNNIKMIVPEQRLSRHRFNKSSISRISYSDQHTNERKVNNFLSINLVSPTKQDFTQLTSENESKRLKNEFDYLNRPKTSKRYVNVKGNLPNKQQSINPYTKKNYLHVQFQVEKKNLKRIQRMIQKSDPSNMKQSFQVKTINPESNTILTSRTLNKTHQNEFMRKVKILGTTSVRKQLKSKKLKNRQKELNQIHGWEIDTKEIAIDHTESI